MEIYRFPNTGAQVRSVLILGEPWFVAADLGFALGYRDAYNATRFLTAAEKGTHQMSTPGGLQEVTVVSEAGLYRMIMRSNQPNAISFQLWIANEVLPDIRRTGRFEVTLSLPKSYAEALRELASTVEERDAAQARVVELEPDAARAQQTIDAEGMSLVGTVAKRFGFKEHELREFLYAQHMLMRDGSRRNEPYAQYVGAGYFEVKATPVPMANGGTFQRNTTYVTPRGEAAIWKRLYEAGRVSSRTMPASQQLVLIAT